MRRPLRVTAALAAFCLPLAAHPQAPVTLPANTPVKLRLTTKVDSKTVKPGTTIDFAVAAPIHSGPFVLLPADTPIHATVTSAAPTFAVTLDPVQLADGSTLTFLGDPFTLQKGQLPKVKIPKPPELGQHYVHASFKEGLIIAGVAVVVVPIAAAALVVASPFMVYDSLRHHDPQSRFSPGDLVLVHSAAPLTVASADFTPQNVYTGPPVLYLVDRYAHNRSDIFCGSEAIVGRSDNRTNLLRLTPGSYPFHTANKSNSTATIDAQPDHRYLVYRDGSGLHTAPVEQRPDLLDLLPPITPATFWFFDTLSLTQAQRETFADRRSTGACPIGKTLRTRPPKPVAGAAPIPPPATP